MIDKLIHDLAVGSELTAEEIMDVLWLSAIRPVADTSAVAMETPEQVSSPPPDGPGSSSPELPDNEAESPPAATQDSPVPLHLGGEPAGNGEQMLAAEVSFGSPQPIRDPLALPRALRRLKQIRAPGQSFVVDMDATVESTADAGRLMTVFTRPLERALDLALVIDGSLSMRIWDDTFDEFERLLVQTGAFRSVSRWRLSVQGNGMRLYDPHGAPHPARRLVDPSGRRLVFVITDATDQCWYTAQPWDAVATWCAAMPTALIQVLPPHYWPATAIGDPYIAARARRPASPNSQYVRRLAWWATDLGGQVLPVVMLTPQALDAWAQAAVSGTAWATGVIATPPDPEYAPSAGDPADPAVLVNDFLARASPGAERLARVLASAATLSMPLISVLQERLAPETGVIELAEGLAGGLLEEIWHAATARQALFRFRQGVREILQRGATTFEEWDAYDAVSRYLEDHQRLGGPLHALIADHTGSAHLYPADEPFAGLQQSLAVRLGIRPNPAEPAAPPLHIEAPIDSGARGRSLAWVTASRDNTEASNRSPMPKPFRVAAAIDFGTHGTGFAWAAVSQDNSEPHNRRISLFEDWPDQSIASPKNRSAVLLDSGGQFLAWGDQAIAQMDAMPPGAGWRLQTGFKMSLQPGPRNATPLAGDGPDAYRLTVLYLQQVVAKAWETIIRGVYEEDDIRWCVTVPAVWDKYTRDLMFRAAVEAGLPDDAERLLLVQEPAAAGTVLPGEGRDSAKHGRDALPRGGRRQQGGHLLLPGGRRRTPERAGVAHRNLRCRL